MVFVLYDMAEYANKHHDAIEVDSFKIDILSLKSYGAALNDVKL